MMKKASFRQQFILFLTLTLVCSVICTAAVWGASIYVLIKVPHLILPANHYEQQIPQIEQWIEQSNADPFSASFQTELEQIIPLEGMDYQVLDLEGQIIYGSTETRLLSNAEAVIRKLNTTESINGHYVKYVPLTDEQQRLVGLYALQYDLNLLSNNKGRALVVLFALLNMAAPFLFILFFTLLFARRMGKTLEPPISHLIEGAKRIQQNNLDFTFNDLGGSKELSQLSHAVEEMRSALQRSLKSQWKMEQERRFILSAIAHDLRTPLTIICGHVDNLLERNDKRADRLERYLATIRRQTERAVRLLNDLSQVSEIDRTDFSLSIQALDLDAFFREKAEEYRLTCQQEGITFVPSITTTEEGNGVFYADPQRLEQVLDNIISNSVRFTPSGGEIQWSVMLSPEQVIVETCDSGPGFAEGEEQHIFERFYQGDPSRSKARGHAGLGLYIVKTLVEKHGGTVQGRQRCWRRCLSDDQYSESSGLRCFRNGGKDQ